jgi:hypothetical protein
LIGKPVAATGSGSFTGIGHLVPGHDPPAPGRRAMRLIVEDAGMASGAQFAGDSPRAWVSLETVAARGTRTPGWGLAEVLRLRALADANRRPMVGVERR